MKNYQIGRMEKMIKIKISNGKKLLNIKISLFQFAFNPFLLHDYVRNPGFGYPFHLPLFVYKNVLFASAHLRAEAPTGVCVRSPVHLSL